MAINNDQDLLVAVAQASALVQEIQVYCGRTLRQDSKISFPRGLIGTADSYRERCPGYLTDAQKSSCAYGFMYLDVLWWVLSRTDLAGVGKEMAIKSAIITLGTILEAVLHIPGEGIFDAASKAGVKLRVHRAAERKWISEAQADDLKKLWDHRNNVHIKLLDVHEFDYYKVEHVNVPHEALLKLMASQKQWHSDAQ